MTSATEPMRIVILGGGFGGMYTALALDRRLGRRADVEVTLVNRDNFFLFTPMLHEVAASELDMTHIVCPIRKLLRHVQFFAGEVDAIDCENRTVTVWHGDDRHHHRLRFDHLVVGVGAVTNFHGLPGLEARALTMKSLADAIALRNRVIANLEEADLECCADQRSKLLTFVIAGGGFAGVETAAAVHDFAHGALRFYRNLTADDLRVVLVHSGEVLLPELGERLGRYAQRKMEQRGMEVLTSVRLSGVSSEEVVLSDGSRIRAGTVVWTAGAAPHPMLATLPCSTERGRIVVDEHLRAAPGVGLWAVGDCAHIMDRRTGRPHPPTAQHALREGRLLARNLLATRDGRPLRPFRFRTLGQLASLGRRSGVANVLGFNFSGFVAWWLWRSIYLSKLPRLEKKVRVMLDWTLDLCFGKDLVQLKTAPVGNPDAPPPPVERPSPARSEPALAGVAGTGESHDA
ncbi:MAG: NAD(P)/FAD-dependent oxidoreductase [Phycisphaerales bacterium]|nr:NAD(P)/FAD-dependent oxidoreductase [Phycisphaerales bacterium]